MLYPIELGVHFLGAGGGMREGGVLPWMIEGLNVASVISCTYTYHGKNVCSSQEGRTIVAGFYGRSGRKVDRFALGGENFGQRFAM
jgi:hypothetical protein